MLLRLAYLGVTNAFSMLRLSPMSGRDKDVEILALRHQITVLERRLGTEGLRLQPSDRGSWRRCCTGSRWTCCVGDAEAPAILLDHQLSPGRHRKTSTT